MDSYICQYLSGELCNIILMIAAWLFLFGTIVRVTTNLIRFSFSRTQTQ